MKKQIKNPYAPAGFHPNLFCCSLHELQPHRNRGEPPESCLRLSFQLTFTPEQTERIEAQKFFSRDGDRDSNICSLQVENIQIYRYGPAFPGPLLAMVMGHKHIYIYVHLCIFMHHISYSCTNTSGEWNPKIPVGIRPHRHNKPPRPLDSSMEQTCYKQSGDAVRPCPPCLGMKIEMPTSSRNSWENKLMKIMVFSLPPSHFCWTVSTDIVY